MTLGTQNEIRSQDYSQLSSYVSGDKQIRVCLYRARKSLQKWSQFGIFLQDFTGSHSSYHQQLPWGQYIDKIRIFWKRALLKEIPYTSMNGVCPTYELAQTTKQLRESQETAKRKASGHSVATSRCFLWGESFSPYFLWMSLPAGLFCYHS